MAQKGGSSRTSKKGDDMKKIALILGAACALVIGCGGSASEQPDQPAPSADATSGASGGADLSGCAGVSGGPGTPGACTGPGGGSDSGGGTNVGGAPGLSGVPPHKELCLVDATCTDGIISGVFGVSCLPFSGRCETGCSANPTWIQVPNRENIWDPALALQYARDALCDEGDGGWGGDSAFGSGGAPGEDGGTGGSPAGAGGSP